MSYEEFLKVAYLHLKEIYILGENACNKLFEDIRQSNLDEKLKTILLPFCECVFDVFKELENDSKKEQCDEKLGA